MPNTSKSGVNARESRRKEAMSAVVDEIGGSFADYIRNQMGDVRQRAQGRVDDARSRVQSRLEDTQGRLDDRFAQLQNDLQNRYQIGGNTQTNNVNQSNSQTNSQSNVQTNTNQQGNVLPPDFWQNLPNPAQMMPPMPQIQAPQIPAFPELPIRGPMPMPQAPPRPPIGDMTNPLMQYIQSLLQQTRPLR